VAIVVGDTGAGIKPEFITHVFERFRQADASTTRRHGGLGLGLSIVKHLVDLHGGQVQASSAGEGQGTTVSVEMPALPLADAPITEGGPETESGLEAEDVQLEALHDMGVLLVEDDAEASEMMTLVLSERGARVRTAADYDGAIAALQQDWPDVLVSDIGLPGRDGYELVRRVREMEREYRLARLPVIALTAFARPEDRNKSLDAGFDLHLSKPLRPHLLLDAIVRSRPAAGT
jgi:CheY-like chemotaxis protein